MTHAVVCLKCQHLVKHNPRQLEGCRCDPDAPTWIAITQDGRLLTMSHANYAELSDE
jgi:hypothetical protein